MTLLYKHYPPVNWHRPCQMGVGRLISTKNRLSYVIFRVQVFTYQRVISHENPLKSHWITIFQAFSHDFPMISQRITAELDPSTTIPSTLSCGQGFIRPCWLSGGNGDGMMWVLIGPKVVPKPLETARMLRSFGFLDVFNQYYSWRILKGFEVREFLLKS